MGNILPYQMQFPLFGLFPFHSSLSLAVSYWFWSVWGWFGGVWLGGTRRNEWVFKWKGPVRAFLCVWDSGCVGGKWILAIISIYFYFSYILCTGVVCYRNSSLNNRSPLFSKCLRGCLQNCWPPWLSVPPLDHHSDSQHCPSPSQTLFVSVVVEKRKD